MTIGSIQEIWNFTGFYMIESHREMLLSHFKLPVIVITHPTVNILH